VTDACISKRHSFNINALAWSPDGTWIAAAGHGHVQVWEAATGENRFSYEVWAPLLTP
jgi:WD40 repeat protein